MKMHGNNRHNEQLQENDIPRKVDRYWVCQQRNGAFPKVLEQTTI